MIRDAVYPNGIRSETVEIVNGTESFVIPLDGFGLDLPLISR